MPHQHIRIEREGPSNERKPKRFFPKRPSDPRALGARLHRSLEQALEADRSISGYDNRQLLKIRVESGFQVDDLAKIPGVEVLSQEDKTIVLAFADARGLENFEQRLTSLARNGKATRKAILFALQAFDNWMPDDRTGPALANFDVPITGSFVVDVELWPLVKPAEREAMRTAFEAFLKDSGIDQLDLLDRPSLLIYRVGTSNRRLGDLLGHRDVRLVDLPPRYGLETELLTYDVNQLARVDPPPDSATLVAVLDSGIASAHPVLGPAVGDTVGFVPPAKTESDDNGHGTRVAGLALFGDVRACALKQRFVPQLRLLSARVFNNDGVDETRFVEKNVEEAVRHFHDEYACRVFCLSYGDANKVYDGRHVRGLAYTLDCLSRELGVLFVVPTGNLQPNEIPHDPRAQYPAYLLVESSQLLDPGTALNALTVGGLSIFEADANAQRYGDDVEVPIARTGQPAPFTRCGPSVNGAVKPEVVAHAGNYAIRRNGGGLEHRRLGVLSSSKDFATGALFSEGVGTSFAAPQIAHTAACVLNHLPDASNNLLRALLVAHSRWPEATVELFRRANGKQDAEAVTKLVGYGQPVQDALFESLDNAVTLYAQDALPDNHHHFYELPLPSDLWSPGKRNRLVTIALAHTPEVRTTRIDYRATQMSFHLVKGANLSAVSAWYRKSRAEDAEEIGEYGTGRLITHQARSRGTVQCASWQFPTARGSDFKLFLVVTRHDAGWSAAKDTPEPYALAITVQDRENVTGQLYQQIRQQVQQRERVRLHVRAGR